MGASVSPKLEEVVHQYDIGELVTCRQLHRGYVNVSYVIETVHRGERRKYFLRRYKPGITAEEIVFEHSVIDHLIDNGFDLVAAVLRTKDGATYLPRLSDGDHDEDQVIFYAVFEFLAGEDRYTWDHPDCNDQELRNAARVLAQFHDAVCDARPEGRRSERGIGDLLPIIARNVEHASRMVGDTVFDTYLSDNVAFIEGHIAQTLRAIDEKACADRVQLVIHCDYHPGNLKYQDSEVTGLFDFDWSKIDARCFDVALALVYFCTPWERDKDGRFQVRKAVAFLEAYQDALRGSARLGPMDAVELACLPHMISAGNVYVLNWAVEDFYAKEVDPHEYLRYLRHHVQLMSWLEKEDNWRQLEDHATGRR